MGCFFPMVVVSILPHAETDRMTIGKTRPTLYTILKIGKCCEGVRAPPTLQKLEN